MSNGPLVQWAFYRKISSITATIYTNTVTAVLVHTDVQIDSLPGELSGIAS